MTNDLIAAGIAVVSFGAGHVFATMRTDRLLAKMTPTDLRILARRVDLRRKLPPVPDRPPERPRIVATPLAGPQDAYRGSAAFPPVPVEDRS